MAWRYRLGAAARSAVLGCLLLSAAACYERDSREPRDAGGRAERDVGDAGDAGEREVVDARAEDEPPSGDAATHADAASPVEPDAAQADASEPVPPDDHDAHDAGTPDAPELPVLPDLPDEPMQPPLELPATSAGACAFEPRPNPPLELSNPKCPDGIVHGNVLLTNAVELRALRDCAGGRRRAGAAGRSRERERLAGAARDRR